MNKQCTHWFVWGGVEAETEVAQSTSSPYRGQLFPGTFIKEFITQ